MDTTLKKVTKLQKYGFLIIVFTSTVSLMLILKLQYLPQVQFLVATVLVMFYLMWALVHHFADKTLSLEVMIEYILTALLALIVLYGVLL